MVTVNHTYVVKKGNISMNEKKQQNVIPSSQVLDVFKKLLQHMQQSESLHTLIIQADSPIVFIDYDGKKYLEKKVIFAEDSVGELSRNFVHDRRVASNFMSKGIATEIYKENNSLIHITILRTDTAFSLVVTVRKDISILEKKYPMIFDYHKVTGDRNTNFKTESHENYTLPKILPELTRTKGLLFITGENNYYNNILGLQIISAFNNHKHISIIPKDFVIATIENPFYADIDSGRSILYRTQYDKDIFAAEELLSNNVLMNQVDVLYTNQAGVWTASPIAKNYYNTLKKSKMFITIEQGKSVRDIIKENFGDNIHILEIKAIQSI